MAVLIPDPVEVTLPPWPPPASEETVTDWVRVESRLMVTPVRTPSDASNCSSSLVPRLVLSSLLLPPPSASVTEALPLNETIDVSYTSAAWAWPSDSAHALIARKIGPDLRQLLSRDRLLLLIFRDGVV